MFQFFPPDVTSKERRRGASLLDKPKMLLLQDCGANLCLTLDDLAPGWRIRPGQHYQVRDSRCRFCLGKRVKVEKNGIDCGYLKEIGDVGSVLCLIFLFCYISCVKFMTLGEKNSVDV